MGGAPARDRGLGTLRAATAAGVWAVTSYFNPAGSRSRRQTYDQFRKHLAAPLVTVELSFSGRFALTANDADVLIQLHGQDVMWHKERLLNIGLEAIPPDCQAVAWLDCDVVFEHPDWPDAVSRALSDYLVVQCFDEVRELRASESLESLSEGRPGISLMRALETEPDPSRLLRHANRRSRGIYSGLAWAARREVLSDGLYDACVLGSGSRAIQCAQLGRPEDAIHYLRMGASWSGHYRQWAERTFSHVRGSVGHIGGKLTHLWHGDLSKRKYVERHIGLSRFTFDPATDLELTEAGIWRWASDKPDMHRYVQEYFRSREENGPQGSAPSRPQE